MKLTEYKTKDYHYFEDEEGRYQGIYKDWWYNGRQWEISYYRDDELHGECKSWNSTGELNDHVFYIDGKIIMNFIKNPELYPSTSEEKTMFALRHGIGDAQFIRENE